ncbi:MAG: hypothetical protein ACLQPD_31120 [Desulfomonilaceae bacterium]
MSKDSRSVSKRRIINALGPEGNFGDSMGFWATSFEFDRSFFETDFLPHLLNLGTWDDRDWVSRIALEKELEKMAAASVMLDPQGYSDGCRPRSLRIEVTPSKGHSGNALHAKVILLVYERAVRLVVGSSNLTEKGYRRNREVVAVLTASEKSPHYGELIGTALVEAKNLLHPWWSEGTEETTERAFTLLEDLPRSEQRSERFVWSGPNKALWRQVIEFWPQGESIREIKIVSPFWSDETGDGPVCRLVRELQKRDILAPEAEVCLLTEASAIGEGLWKPVLPTSYGAFDFRSLRVSCRARAVDPRVAREEMENGDEQRTRSLHSKLAVFKGQSTTLAYLGSANFTRHGWGFMTDPTRANIEAGIIIIRAIGRSMELEGLLPAGIGDFVELKGGKTFHGLSAEGTGPPWPHFLRKVCLSPADGPSKELCLLVLVDAYKIEGPWSIGLIGTETGISQPKLLQEDGSAGDREYKVELPSETLNRLMMDQEVQVSWWDHTRGCRFPVNVSLEARDDLPVAPGSSAPTERALIDYYQGQIAWEDVFPQEDPDDGNGLTVTDDDGDGGIVDTSGIQSYLIRDFVQALDGIRYTLNKASESERSMRMALIGTVSPVKLAEAILHEVRAERRTAVAAGFQLVEILGCLEYAARLPSKDKWEPHRLEAVSRLRNMLEDLRKDHPDELSSQGVFGQYEQQVYGYWEQKGV